jgi:hypothetical protein
MWHKNLEFPSMPLTGRLAGLWERLLRKPCQTPPYRTGGACPENELGGRSSKLWLLRLRSFSLGTCKVMVGWRSLVSVQMQKVVDHDSKQIVWFQSFENNFLPNRVSVSKSVLTMTLFTINGIKHDQI